MPKHLLPTTVVGSYPQPEWLVDRAMLSKVVPRTRMHAMWRLPEQHLEEAQDDATIVAIRDMERAGIDIVTDGEIRRESYSNRFATALEGIDIDNPAMIKSRSGQETPVPRVVGKVSRTQPVELRDMEFLRRNTDRAAKITLPGPFTMSQQASNEFYEDDEELAMAFAEAVNAEALDLQKAGADVIQLDEPWVRNNPELAKRYAVKAINRALRGITVPTVVHLCFGYAAVVPGSTKPAGYSFLAELADTTADQISIEAAQPKLDLGVLKDLSSKKIMLGVLDLGSPEVETVETVADAYPPWPEIRRRGTPDPRAGLRHEIHAAPHRLRQAEGDVRRGRDGAQGNQLSRAREPGRPGVAPPDLELAVGLRRRDDHVLGAAVAAVRIAPGLVVFGCHHVDEGGDRGIIHQRQIVPLMAVWLPERDRLGVAGPQQRAAARLDHRHRQGAVAQIRIPARAVAVQRAGMEPHQVHHHDRPLLLQLLQALDIQQIHAHRLILTRFDSGIVALRRRGLSRGAIPAQLRLEAK